MILIANDCILKSWYESYLSYVSRHGQISLPFFFLSLSVCLCVCVCVCVLSHNANTLAVKCCVT